MADHDAGQWLQRFGRVESAARRMICFGHAGSTCTTFKHWPANLGAETEVFGAQLPGRGARIHEAPRSDICAMAKEIANDAACLAPMPTILFGHSVGGLFAYEVAQELVALDQTQLTSVVVSATSTSTTTPLDEIGTDNQAEVLEHLNQHGYLSAEQIGNAKFVELVLPYLTADILCKTHWRPESRPPLPAPIHTFAWLDDAFLKPWTMRSWHAKSERPELGESYKFPGGHLEYLSHPPDMFAALDGLFPKDLAVVPRFVRARDQHVP